MAVRGESEAENEARGEGKEGKLKGECGEVGDRRPAGLSMTKETKIQSTQRKQEGRR